MQQYWEIFREAFTGYASYFWQAITEPGWQNYFYILLLVSLLFWGLEIFWPWRKNQRVFRKDFWLDGFYMFFNFFLFSLLGYYAVSKVTEALFQDFLDWLGVENLVALEIASWPVGVQVAVLFVVRDFVHWNVHRMLHRVPWLWEFHKVHHSVREMGFAAHLRYHWMETVTYRSMEYVPISMIGFGVEQFFFADLIALSIGHFNHSNFYLPLGPLKYVFNNPQMHIWHHARELPRPHGVNFGISLSLWDYLFGTAYLPHSGRDIELGFEQVEEFPEGFLGQETYPLSKS